MSDQDQMDYCIGRLHWLRKIHSAIYAWSRLHPHRRRRYQASDKILAMDLRLRAKGTVAEIRKLRAGSPTLPGFDCLTLANQARKGVIVS